MMTQKQMDQQDATALAMRTLSAHIPYHSGNGVAILAEIVDRNKPVAVRKAFWRWRAHKRSRRMAAAVVKGND